jgi:hypothetical protein
MSRFFSYVYLYPFMKSNFYNIKLLYREYEKNKLIKNKINTKNNDVSLTHLSDELKENKKFINPNLNIYKYILGQSSINQSFTHKNDNIFNPKNYYEKFILMTFMTP